MTVPVPAPEAPARPPFSTFALMRRLFMYRPWLFWLNVAVWGAFHSLPAAFSYYASRVFGALEVHATHLAWLMVLGFAVARFGRFGVFAVAFRTWIRLWYLLDALVRRNLMAHLLTAPGSRRLPDTPAEAVSRFRDDVDEVAAYTESFVDGGGLLLYTLIAVTLMWRADPLITVVVCTPMLLMVLVVRRLSPTIRTYRRRMREATSRVTDFVGETFAAVSSVKLSGAEPRMTDHLAHLGETRRAAALRDVLLTELIRSVNTNMVTIGTGLVLLLAAARLRAGSLSVGDLLLFAAMLPRLAGSMSFFGNMIAQHRRTGVSFERMTRLLQDAPPEQIVVHHNLHFMGEPPAPPPPPPGEPLRELRVEHLSAVHAGGRGVHDVSFGVRRGEFVVVTGRIGSGKSTLLRALLGLLPPTGGEVRWNGAVVADPAAFFVPPRSAYTAQLPSLFSESLRENVLLGEAPERLDLALHLAVMDPDLQQLSGGLDTPVGARGVKLSGGQVQRAAVARMLAREADLLVFDDVSSALDAETEQRLWAGLAASREATCLVVSHRRAALARADRILLLEEGHLTDSGRLTELLERSAEMRALWAGLEAEEAGAAD